MIRFVYRADDQYYVEGEKYMTVKESVLLLLEQQKGEFLSGQEIADKIFVTRASVWKAIKALQSEGYSIEAVTNKGYAIKQAPDILSAVMIKEGLKEPYKYLEVKTEKSVDSTNTKLKYEVNVKEEKDMVLLAEEQTGGRGRLGRAFFSPNGTGLYMSLLLHPKIANDQGGLLTTAAAAAVAIAIEKISGESAQIKWVNDIWMRGKKVAGILTEASASLEAGHLEYAIVGIGINVVEPQEGFPEELQDIAGAIFSKDIQRENLRNQLAAEILNQFMEYYKHLEEKSFLQEYKKRSFVIGKNIKVIKANSSRKAKALEVDDSFQLKVQYEDGSIETLSSGEISIRL